MKKRIYLLSLFLAFSVIFVSCKKDDDVKKKDEVENNGNNGNNGGNNNGGNNNGGNNGGTNNVGSAENNTILAHDNTEGQLTKAHASAFAGNTVAVFINGNNQSNLDVRLILGPGELPKTDRSYDLQGIVFTAQNEKAFISVQNGRGSENTWYTVSKLGGQLHAKVEADGSIIFSFDNVTFEVSKPPYNETKVFSGKFTLPADFATSSASKPVQYDLAD